MGVISTIQGVRLTKEGLRYVQSVRDRTERPDDISPAKWQATADLVEYQIARAHVPWSELMRAVGCGPLMFASLLSEGMQAVGTEGKQDGKPLWLVRERYTKICADMMAFTGRYRGKQAKETPANVPVKRKGKPSDRGAVALLSNDEGVEAG